MKKINHLLIAIFLLLSINAFAEESFKNKLSQVMDKIKNLKEQLVQHQHQQVDAQKELHQTETSINSLTQALNKTVKDLHQHEQSLSQLSQQTLKIQKRIQNQQKALLTQIKAQYLLGLDKNKSQIWLQTKDYHKIDRLLTYNHYLTKRTQQLTYELKNDLTELEQNKNEIVDLVSKTKKLQSKQNQQQQVLSVHKQKQQVLLVNLNSQVKSKSQQLAELLRNKENLEKTIQNLQKKETYKSEFLTHHKGKFPWPTEGRILERFGSNIAQSELKQNGLLISAPEGQKVYAVAPGKVIFANSMPGYGLLIIIDHGHGYMTLYGNNGALYKKEHDLVSGHDLIAKVGHGNGNQKSSLYFALRHEGKAIDPSTWCG